MTIILISGFLMTIIVIKRWGYFLRSDAKTNILDSCFGDTKKEAHKAPLKEL